MQDAWNVFDFTVVLLGLGTTILVCAHPLAMPTLVLTLPVALWMRGYDGVCGGART